MFGKMKKMFKDEDAGAILGAATGSGVFGTLAALLGGVCGGAVGLFGWVFPCVPPCGWCCGAIPACTIGGAGLGGTVLGAICAVPGALVGCTFGAWVDHLTIMLSACFGSVGSCINFIPSLIGGMLGK